ncbi:EAL domain-containing protein [Methylobacterium sp. BTF04]|nr:EAL domain-containing protein [Methylobacterium sp. BTF04]
MLDVDRTRSRSSSEADIRQKVQSERLRLLESVAVHARDSILITEAEPTDLPGPRILYCNAAFTRTTGYSEAEVIGKTPRILQGPKTDPASRAKLREAFARWKPIEIELMNYHKDGSEFWVELSIVPVADENGWYTHWVSVQRDITERKQADELATRVRIAEVKNETLAIEIQERKRVEAELLYTAFHDSLTGLRNRAFFMERLTVAIGHSRDLSTPGCAVIFLDLDRFKAVNDSLGHIAGDALLKEVGSRLKRCTRSQDTLARIGGDEFAVLVESTVDLATSVDIAESIIAAMRAPIRIGQQTIFPSCSIGVVRASDQYQSPEDLIGDADIAMYQAKRAGRGDYAIFSESMRAEAVAALALQTDVRLALKRGEFLLYYQPIFDLASGRVDGFEALIRWQHPQRGLVSPAEFIPVAEEIGLIRRIDRWVLREACAQLRMWHDRFGDQTLHMSVNTSVSELRDDTFVDEIKSVLEEFALEPRNLQIEITEGIFLVPSASVTTALANIRALGVRVALDDFGTGYSSLSYINRYPVDTIKIDRAFVSDMRSEKRTLAIIDLVVKLGAALNVSIVAEGIEHAEEATLLADMGCSHAQGYYFGRPLSSKDTESLIDSKHLDCSEIKAA